MTRVGLHVLVRFGVAALVIAAVAAFGSIQANAQDSEIIITIEELNGSGISGDATLTDNGDGTTTIDVLVDGATGDHPMHLHSGTCAELGDVVVPLTNVDAEGSSVTDVDVPLATIQDPEIGPHAINIHLSPDEISTYVACGDVPLLETSAVGGETDDDAAGGETTATETVETPATGVGSSFGSDNSIMIIMGMVAAAVVFAAGMGLRRSAVRA
jgi:hypothetical protein